MERIKGLLSKKANKIVNYFPVNLLQLLTLTYYKPKIKLALPIAVLLTLLDDRPAAAQDFSILLATKLGYLLTNCS